MPSIDFTGHKDILFSLILSLVFSTNYGKGPISSGILC